MKIEITLKSKDHCTGCPCIGGDEFSDWCNLDYWGNGTDYELEKTKPHVDETIRPEKCKKENGL
jgi:hypothetical protein